MPTNNNNDVNQQNILIKKRFYIPKNTPGCNRIYSKFKTPSRRLRKITKFNDAVDCRYSRKQFTIFKSLFYAFLDRIMIDFRVAPHNMSNSHLLTH